MVSAMEISVLVIDDDKVDRLIVKRLLAEYASVYEAASELEALETLKEKVITCVVLDRNIPGTNTNRLLESLVSMTVPVLVLTGLNDESVKKEMIKLGAGAFLTKDELSESTLKGALEKAINHPI